MTSTDLGSAEWERSKISGQDINMLKKMGFSKKENALQFPKEESYPKPPINYRVSFVDHLIRGLSPPIHEFLRGLLFVYGLQLHHLTPNSLLHISIFITLCECFLGVQPNWALWKRIFCIRRNSHHNVAYNIGGVVICVRSEVDYFDVKFPDSVQGWRKKWLYIHEESSNPAEENIAPFDGEAKILRRRSWDAEAAKLATEALMTRIHELQNTRGKELSGIEITAYFLRTRVQPLQARKNPFWKYAGEEDADRLSKDLPLKDFEKIIRKISSLNKKDLVPTSCRVAPYSSAKPLPEGHLVLASLPPLPEGGEVEERAVVDDDNQSTTRPATEIAGSHKSTASAEGILVLDNVAAHPAGDRRSSDDPQTPYAVPPRFSPSTTTTLAVGSSPDPTPLAQRTDSMEPYVQTETYDLENGGSLVFERDLYLVSERLERPPPKFHGVRIHDTPTGEQQWMITADLKGSSEPPISERILFSFKACNWPDGLAHALQEGLARVCGQHIAALRGSRFAYFARHDTMGEPMAPSSHPVLMIHVQHLDLMLHETRKDLERTRVYNHRAQMTVAHHAEAIRMLAKDRKILRLQRAKKDATIRRLREKIRTLEVTVRTQQDQIQEMEEEGDDIQGGDDFLSDDNDYEDDEFTDEEDYEFLEAAEDGIIPIDVDEDDE
ncbi:hypothetical protein QYE76_068836 [Lolium multiflorum]|uniref:Transposase (putative) gypsy type domain-containing protein n=1 Tax=Lolium multiflorum TaxID=4521 RepID=A0AAD8WC30_LOLMU|nr:hypothetical protein QYE76_068836 [Lolium multiflorum]